MVKSGLIFLAVLLASSSVDAQVTPINDLYPAVSAACGNCIQGIRLGNMSNIAAWDLDFIPEATAEQKSQAQTVLKAFDLNAWKAQQTDKLSYADAVSAGIAVSSKSSPALSGTYAIDTAARSNIDGIYSGIKNGDGLPGGGDTFNYADIKGSFHTFSADQFVAFSKAVRDYVYALSQKQTVNQPVQIP